MPAVMRFAGSNTLVTRARETPSRCANSAPRFAGRSAARPFCALRPVREWVGFFAPAVGSVSQSRLGAPSVG